MRSVRRINDPEGSPLATLWRVYPEDMSSATLGRGGGSVLARRIFLKELSPGSIRNNRLEELSYSQTKQITFGSQR